MTLSHGCVVQNFPECSGMAEGEVRIVRNVPSSNAPNGVTTLQVKRLTSEYYSVKEV